MSIPKGSHSIRVGVTSNKNVYPRAYRFALIEGDKMNKQNFDTGSHDCGNLHNFGGDI